MKIDLISLGKKAIPFIPRYHNFARFLEESDHWEAQRLRTFQLQEMKRILCHAYRHCPFYTHAFDEAGFSPYEFQDFSQLQSLPILTRANVASRLSEIQARNFPLVAVRQISTSGTSTGTPLNFTENWGATVREQIFISNLWGRIGYNESDRKAVLRGNVVYTRWNRRPWLHTGSSLFLSMYHLTPITIGDYIQVLREYRPVWLHVYPSALVFLIQLLGEKRAKSELGSLCIKGVFCGSEKVYDWQRALIEKVLGTRVLSWYGMTEKVLLAGECEKCSVLHVYPQYGYLEAIPQQDGRAKVVATGFLNYATPFIRYEVGDLMIPGKDRCAQCGRNFPLIDEIIGRELDFVVTKNGILPFSFSIASIHSDAWADVSEWQIFQEKPGRVVVMIVPSNPSQKPAIEHKIRHELQVRFQSSLDVDIRWMTHLPRTGTGKFKYFVQQLELDSTGQIRGPSQETKTDIAAATMRYQELPSSRSYSCFDTTYPEFKKLVRGGMRYLFFGRRFQWASPEQIRHYQLERLRRVLAVASETIPFYRDRFRRIGFEPGDLKSLDDLKLLPILQKQEVRDHFWGMFDSKNSWQGILCQTSGTTGEPLRFLLSREQVCMEWADIWRCWIWAGYRPYDRVAAFRHYEPKPGEPVSRYERHSNTLFFSVYDMEERRLPEYVGNFNRFRPRIMRGYPSSIYILASFAKEKKLQLHSPRAIITSSETLLPQYRSLIEEVFRCPVFDWYGTNERVLTACQCERRASYHISAGAGIGEYLDLDPSDRSDTEAKSLVVTTLTNRVMPLIRYKVGDLVYPEAGTCACGRGLPILRSIVGRLDDIIITGENKYVSPIRFYVLFQDFDMIRQFQIVQTEPNEVLVRLNCVRVLSDGEISTLMERLRRLLGNTMRIEIVPVEEIQPQPSGKVRNVVSPHSRFTRELTSISH